MCRDIDDNSNDAALAARGNNRSAFPLQAMRRAANPCRVWARSINWKACQSTRGCGGTGRRASLRSLWEQSRGGSSPLNRTRLDRLLAS